MSVAFRLVKRENIRLRCQERGSLCASCFVFGLFNANWGKAYHTDARPATEGGAGGRVVKNLLNARVTEEKVRESGAKPLTGSSLLI